MKKKLMIGIGVAVLGVIAIAYSVLNKPSSSSSGVFVQKVESLQQGGIPLTSNRFTGVAQAMETLDIKADSAKKVAEILVSVNQDVKVGDDLFRYDVSSAQSTLETTKLDIEGLNNDIAALNQEISDLNSQRNQASAQEQLQYTTEIQSKQMQIRQNQLDIQGKQNDIKRLELEINNSTVKASIDGTVRVINSDGGNDPTTGQELPLLSISQTGDLRIKGLVDELSISSLSVGMPMQIISRANPNDIWSGTISKIDSEPTKVENGYGNMSDTSNQASKYSFYVTLDTSEGLRLGQHVFLDASQTSIAKDGLWLDQSFVVQEGEESYVWIRKNGTLHKNKVTLGETDDTLFTVKIEDGLTKDDYIAYPDPSYKEGMATTTGEPS